MHKVNKCAYVGDCYGCNLLWAEEGCCYIRRDVFVLSHFVSLRNIVILYTYLTCSQGMFLLILLSPL